VQPILHLSIPVRDLEEARTFYVEALGCEAARAREGYQDVWFYGMQVTLQDRADEAGGAYPGSVRHFGVTLGRDDFDALAERLAASAVPCRGCRRSRRTTRERRPSRPRRSSPIPAGM
jgi:extradiol dioxygenase family protein